ncbi:hypothetical protein CAPTEDRAFT_201231 [Capitella teleta]|uniref:RAVE complex protein Rav1 C-terminal domain-containing protein n=1 Tax=Capitella teleta TaxID=283909 RepID=R7UUF5_CAPTE|nr:hypothetical protein CAPTEDRAFT_201231 [Capitella teleta]|eukprot:ELU10253.1 hypothetical protein CAPTEDRAFT_201231 [Capitella teleta]
MNRHQVLTGAANAGDHCFAVGSVEGVHFTAYAAGCDIAILASDFQRVQIIPGAAYGNIEITCIDACVDAGKIAASFGNHVHIFEPTPLLHPDSSHKLDYHWYHTGSVEAKSLVHALSFNQDGSRLITAGDCLQLWQSTDPPHGASQHEEEEEEGVEFFIEEKEESVHHDWGCLWQCYTANTVHHAQFSPDGLLFATLGKADRMVKIWYENKKIELPMMRQESSLSPVKRDEMHFSFIYIAHPRAVTGFSWRKTSKYMPRGSVAHMLVTSCRDNVCRLWVETILPEDGLVDLQQLDPAAAHNPMFHTHRHKKRFLQRLHHMRNLMHKRKSNTPTMSESLNAAQSVHDFHKFGVHPNSVAPGFHFHLAASINPDTGRALSSLHLSLTPLISDIPLMGPMASGGLNFVVHWLNNKELHFTLESESLLQELARQGHSSHDTEDSASDEYTATEAPTEPVLREPKRQRLPKSLSYMSTESERSNMSSLHQPPVHNTKGGTGVDPLDHRIELLLQDWHRGADMLFSVHPVDGSYLVWMVEWLDEPTPGCFRQAQVSFSSCIPSCFPLGDALSMSPHLLLYCNYGKVDLKAALLKESETNAMGKSSPGQSDNTLTPNVLMLSKQSNGSLNLWQISFAEGSAFSTVLSIALASRACGHRFQTNSAACHPVLPLLLTTSHHNAPHTDCNMNDATDKQQADNVAFCSELILWRVDPVGPLSKSGGISELARINSPEMSAFSTVAWLPTLLPSSTLGSRSNSPSALFVASDGNSLRVFQAVIDGRTLLHDHLTRKRKEVRSGLLIGWSSFSLSPPALLSVQYQQSTARPGCILEMDAICDARQDWQHIQLMHIFQEQLVTAHGQRAGQYDRGGQAHLEALVDLQNVVKFEEHFYLVVVERLPNDCRSVLHMWRVVIASETFVLSGPQIFAITLPSGIKGMPFFNASSIFGVSYFGLIPPPLNTSLSSSSQVCTQVIDLPDTVSVQSITMAAGHLSSSSIYPACFAPYLLSGACSDGRVRFWRCQVDTADLKTDLSKRKYSWTEWNMMIQSDETSAIKVAGKPLQVSCAYSGRVAVAYRMGPIRSHSDEPGSQYVNLYVSIYECESSGGSEWTLEDTIELKNISIPEPRADIDLSLIYDNDSHMEDDQVIVSPTLSTPAVVKTMPVPSPSTIRSVKQALSERETQPLSQRHLVQLDWVSTEDGSHILTVAVGSRILIYAAVSSELSQNARQETPEPKASKRGMLQKSKSMTVQTFVEEIRWMKIRSIELSTDDGLSPLPVHLSWVRDGLLVVGMTSEMHVYSQWKTVGDAEPVAASDSDSTDKLDTRTLTELSLQKVSSNASLSLPTSKQPYKLSQSMSSIKLDASICNLSMLAERKLDKKKVSQRTADTSSADGTAALASFIQECGLFEASRMANPVLPQYHPKQLIELLNFGKIRRVKAILAHLVRCISGNDSQQGAAIISHETSQNRPRLSSRAMSLATPNNPPDGSALSEESAQTDYVEISSIPPLPLYALLAADSDKNIESGAASTPGGNQDYNTLFSTESMDENLEDPFDMDEVFGSPKTTDQRKRNSSVQGSINQFGPPQSQLLTRHLTHTQLPGLSSLDQMYLLALADTVARTKLDFSEKHASSKSKKSTLEPTDMISTDSIDDCGLRFMLAARHHVYLMNTLSLGQRAQLQAMGLHATYYVWAFHSEAEEVRLFCSPTLCVYSIVQKGSPTWTELKQFGAGWWITNINTLRRIIEKVAKAAFQAKQDPLDAAIFYMAMKKKNVLWGLFRSVNNPRMQQFFRNDFAEERWRKAALKNAFALLGKQRFHHAAAFFILAGALRDAIEVCIHKLDDFQLAMVIAQLYESDEPSPGQMHRLLYEECLGCDASGQKYSPGMAHPDPFVRSMAYWRLKDYSAALGTLLEVGLGGTRGAEQRPEGGDFAASDPSVFNFYNYLRTHPLLVRQHLAMTAADKAQTVLLSGFSHGVGGASSEENNVTYVDCITPVERRLYFQTAHAHFKSGCPALALEVLNKLPEVIDTENDITKSKSADSFASKANIQSGILENGPSHDFDWQQSSKGLSNGNETASAFDWDQPIAGQNFEEEKLELSFDLEIEDDTDTKSDSEVEVKEKLTKAEEEVEEEGVRSKQDGGVGDIMAQQLKFVACLKIMMEELSTLATGFEVDGGQLRFQLYVWLEKEVQVLKSICNYGHDIQHATPSPSGRSGGQPVFLSTTHFFPPFQRWTQPVLFAVNDAARPTLHEVILAEKMDFEAKLKRMARRKQWLKAHQQLLRTLLSYSVLHGSGGGGLASVRMELILLLQELQQEKTQAQLLSPLPFPTSLPLLSAAVASSKTVIADPIQYLRNSTQDILHTIVAMHTPPAAGLHLAQSLILRSLSAALSACIYQCLCDSDSFVVAISDVVDVGMEGFTSTNVVYKDSYLMAGAQRRRKTSCTAEEVPNSPPAKWPGVTSLRALLQREKDEDSPRLPILLAESLVSVYMSLLTHALATYDANILYRLVAHTFKEVIWHALFGGGVRNLIRLFTQDTPSSESLCLINSPSRQRLKMNMRLLHQGAPPRPPTGPGGKRLKEDKPTYKEKFVPPKVSMISYFMTKPYVCPDDTGVDYDSAESLSSEEEEDDDDYDTFQTRNEQGLSAHLDPNCYSWCLLRYAIIYHIRRSLLAFLPSIGIELPELPVCSPLLQALLQTLLHWQEVTLGRLTLFNGPPDDYIPGCYKEGGRCFSPMEKYKAMLEACNTPFLSSHYSALPVKRLWHYLVREPQLLEIFIRHIFKQRSQLVDESADTALRMNAENGANVEFDGAMKVIHKDQDMILSFCINQANLNCVSLGTQKEVIEMDISGILNPPVWLEDDTEYDIAIIQEPSPAKLEADDFLLVQTPADRLLISSSGGSSLPSMPPSAPGVLPAPSQMSMSQTGRGGSVLTKRPVAGARRMGSHPQLPYYLTGSQDGSVRLWEWGHSQCIAVARQPGSFPKVTRVLFNAQGNKFGVSDVEGSLCLWQVGLGLNMNKPYLSLKCHNKTTSDFVFVGSSSFLSTAGHSSESKNVCLWDTLLPQRSALVQGFHCHTDGAVAVLYAPQHQVLISAGKRGDVSIFDVRQRHLRHSFQAHDGPIKCMSLDPMEEYFVTGAADGDIKIWGLTVHNLIHSFTGEHSKGSIFRNMGSGVTQLYVSPNSQLFSCGSDGSMKVRQLPTRNDSIVKSYTASTLSGFM